MTNIISDTINHRQFTPQIQRNNKSQQLNQINKKISLLKRQLEKEKHQTSLDQIHLQKINSFSQQFEKKLHQEILKCQQLKQNKLETTENVFQDNLRSQNQLTALKSNKNLYNSQRQNSKTHLDSHIQTIQTSIPNKLPHNKDQRNHGSGKRIKNSHPGKVLHSKSVKNAGQKEKNINFYLKETFLTSIIFIVLGTVFRQIISTV